MKQSFLLCLLLLGIGFSACKTDPIIPDGVVIDPNNPNNPGSENLCMDGEISFQYEIDPMMVSNCAFSGCHDAITAEDDIILDSYTNIIKEVTPGKPNKSELYESITDNGEDIMPPSPYAPLSGEQIALVKKWIEQGALNTNCGTPCDPTESTFAATIFPLNQQFCFGCHNDNLASGNVNLKDYNNILPYITDGSYLGSIEHLSDFANMPPSGGKMSDCRINQIKKWIDEGAQNN